MKKHVLAATVSLLILTAFFITGCSPKEKRSMTVLELLGTVEVLAPEGEEWAQLSADDVIAAGSTLRTADDGYAHLFINDGTDIGLSPNTEVCLSELSLEMQNPVTEFELLNGDFFVVVTKSLGSGHFTVNTELGSASVVGSVMSIIYDETGRVINILCYEGEVEAERGIGAQSLKAGDAAIGKDDRSQFTTRPISEVQTQKTAEDTCWWTKNGDKIPFNYTPTPSPSPSRTPRPSPTPTPAPTPILATPTSEATAEPSTTIPMQTLRPTLAPAPPTAEEEANEGTHAYNFTANYKNGASGPASGTLTMTVEFSGNQVTLSSGGQSSAFYKVAENTYEAADESGYVTVLEFTQTGLRASAWGVDWVYTRAD